jgi:hypothetical protein
VQATVMKRSKVSDEIGIGEVRDFFFFADTGSLHENL